MIFEDSYLHVTNSKSRLENVEIVQIIIFNVASPKRKKEMETFNKQCNNFFPGTESIYSVMNHIQSLKLFNSGM